MPFRIVLPAVIPLQPNICMKTLLQIQRDITYTFFLRKNLFWKMRKRTEKVKVIASTFKKKTNFLLSTQVYIDFF